MFFFSYISVAFEYSITIKPLNTGIEKCILTMTALQLSGRSRKLLETENLYLYIFTCIKMCSDIQDIEGIIYFLLLLQSCCLTTKDSFIYNCNTVNKPEKAPSGMAEPALMRYLL